MHADITNLHSTAPRPLPFAPSMAMRSFLCRRERGNVLVYASGGLEDERSEIDDLGGVARHYLNHRHEAEHVPRPAIARTLIHEDDRDAQATGVEEFSARHHLDDDFEVIPTPGHTPGATAFLWDTGERRVLFTGDTIFFSGREWVAAVLASSDRTRYVESLELLRGLDFDVLVPWIAPAGAPHLAMTDGADARRRLGAILDRVARGEDR